MPVGQRKNQLRRIGRNQQTVIASVGERPDATQNVVTVPDGAREEFLHRPDPAAAWSACERHT
jgi:hypothetical protein